MLRRIRKWPNRFRHLTRTSVGEGDPQSEPVATKSSSKKKTTKSKSKKKDTSK